MEEVVPENKKYPTDENPLFKKKHGISETD